MKNIGDYESINCLNPLDFIIDEEDGSIEEKNGNTYLVFASIDKKGSIRKVHRSLGWD